MAEPLYDIGKITAALELLTRVRTEAQLASLYNLCVNNGGIWPAPLHNIEYQPVLFEVGLFGVPAVATDINDLPRNWIKAAQKILLGLHDDDRQVA